MLLEIYILWNCLAFLFMLVAFFRNRYIDASFFSFVSFIMFIILGISSFNVEKSYCVVVNDTTSTWSCYSKSFGFGPISYFYLGLGLLMFIFGIVFAFTESGELIDKTMRGNVA